MDLFTLTMQFGIESLELIALMENASLTHLHWMRPGRLCLQVHLTLMKCMGGMFKLRTYCRLFGDMRALFLAWPYLGKEW